MEKKDQTALTALRDEMRKIFEPCGARIEQLDIQLVRRSLRWRSKTPDYPSHHVGGAFEEWTTSDRAERHRVTVVIVRDESLLDPRNAAQHRELFESCAMPERMMQPNIWDILRAFGIALENPVVSVIAATGVWTTRR
jgi:hypothetical protein